MSDETNADTEVSSELASEGGTHPLLERSSFGTPGARQLRARTPKAAVTRWTAERETHLQAERQRLLGAVAQGLVNELAARRLTAWQEAVSRVQATGRASRQTYLSLDPDTVMMPVRLREEMRATFGGQSRQRTHVEGVVKEFNTDTGEVTVAVAVADDDGDVFVHYSAIQSAGYRTFDEGQEVEFDVTRGPKGPAAENVRPL
jgi:CspA family cold shock protein